MRHLSIYLCSHGLFAGVSSTQGLVDFFLRKDVGVLRKLQESLSAARDKLLEGA